MQMHVPAHSRSPSLGLATLLVLSSPRLLAGVLLLPSRVLSPLVGARSDKETGLFRTGVLTRSVLSSAASRSTTRERGGGGCVSSGGPTQSRSVELAR